ncbi:hypothetical protein HX867_04115 [Pseudomonas gingeri]|uniref:hypothetical protein n=1 Tax=Pseudomonas gingeri TaxID=117681 RepID=UPI0015A463C8|nr:hypothetical protein [Pseudomonas gingeri]NVZ61259.1 hypothetical protein [Pseudomonas gingeri]NVZ77155.1 hypothetical protein [Pseudomonas gingeri]NWE46337.1 hypothetical protein [Pseudomonas gingeri]
MSWLDGLVEDNEAASQDQRFERTADKLAPGVFTGAYGAIGQGLVRGGIEAVNTVKSLAVQAAGADQALSLGLSGMVLDGQDAEEQAQQVNADTERRARDIGKDTAQAVQLLRPDPTEVGFVGQILGEAAAILPRTVVGSIAAGPLGAAVAAGGPAGYASKQVGVAEGLDEGTATGKAFIDAATVGVGAFLPAARFVGPVIGDAAIAVGANVGLGMAGRGGTAALLEHNGYSAQAAQYRAMDGTAIITDAVLGAAFFGLARAGMRKPTTDQVDAALTERTYQHADVDTAPGAPINPRSAVAHQDAIRTAIDQLSRGESVVLPESIHSAQFMRGLDEPRPMAPTRESARVTARQDLEPTMRLELEQEAVGILPNVRDVKAELSTVARSLDALDDSFRARAKEFQQQGQSRKRAEQSARQAIQDERMALSDRQAALTDSLSNNRSAELARGDLAAMDRGEIPQRFQGRVDQRADAIVQGFDKNPLAAGVAEGNKMSMAQIARQEIARILDDIERADPTLQAKPLDIGASKNVEKPETAPAATGKPGGESGAPKVTTPDKPGADVVNDAGKGGGEASDPVLQVADEILSRVDDMRLATGALDADGNPVTVSAREMLAQADAEIQAAQQDARGFAAAAACFLQRGDV